MTGGYRHHRIRHGNFPKPAAILRTHPNFSRKGVSARRHNNACFASRAEFRRANRRKNPRSCAGPDPGPGRRPCSGPPHATPSRSSDTPSRPCNHHGGYRPGGRDDDDRARQPPPPPNPPRGGLLDLPIRCHYSNHKGQCERICTLHKGQFLYRLVRKHTTLTFCTANCMGYFVREELDTLISQPFPPEVRRATDALLNQRVLALLKGKCPDNPRSGYTWPLRSLLDRTVRITTGMDLQDRNMCAVFAQFLYDIAINAVNYQVKEDGDFNRASVGLLCWAEDVQNQHLFRVVCLDANSAFHCDRWGLELPGRNPTKSTYAPRERSNGKRRQDFPNPSVSRSPHLPSASSSSSDPRGPIADVNGQSRGGGSSSNYVHQPPARVSTPPVSNINPHLILSREVPRLLKSKKSWWSVGDILNYCMAQTNPEECKSLAVYLQSFARVGYVSPHDKGAIEHAACSGLIQWANLAVNKPRFATLGIPASQDPDSLMFDQHPGDIHFLSDHWDMPLPPPVPQLVRRAQTQRRLPRFIDLSTDRSLISADLDPSPGAGDVLSGIILSLLSQPEAPNEPWWSIDALLEKGINLPNSGSHRSSVVHTSNCLVNYLQALGTIGVSPPTGYNYVLAAGLFAWARLPGYRHLVVIFEHDNVYRATAFGSRHRPPNHVLGIGERYYFRLPDRPLTEPNSPSTPDSPPPPSPPRDDKGPPIIIKGNQDGSPAHSDPFTPHPDPDPTVNPRLGKAVTNLLCFQGPTAQDSYTVSELIGHLTELSEDMTDGENYQVRWFRRYLKLCAAEYSVTTGDDHTILSIGLLRWAKFSRNNLIYICFESYPPASHPGNRWRLKVNEWVHPDVNALSTPVTTPAPYATPPINLFADAILSKIVTELLKKPSSRHDEW